MGDTERYEDWTAKKWAANAAYWKAQADQHDEHRRGALRDVEDFREQLAGAVEALEEIARLEHVNAADAAVNVAGRVAREALDRLRGQ